MSQMKPAPAFSGWLRLPRQRWKLVLQAETERECWLALLAEVPASRWCDKIVLPTGSMP